MPTHCPQESILTGKCAKYCVIGQKFVGGFVYARKHSDNNFFASRSWLFCFQTTRIMSKSSCPRESESMSSYMTLLDPYRNSQMAKNSWVEITQKLCKEEFICSKVWHSIMDLWPNADIEVVSKREETLRCNCCRGRDFPGAWHSVSHGL